MGLPQPSPFGSFARAAGCSDVCWATPNPGNTSQHTHDSLTQTCCWLCFASHRSCSCHTLGCRSEYFYTLSGIASEIQSSPSSCSVPGTDLCTCMWLSSTLGLVQLGNIQVLERQKAYKPACLASVTIYTVCIWSFQATLTYSWPRTPSITLGYSFQSCSI